MARTSKQNGRVPDKLRKATKVAEERLLYAWEQLEEWQHDNHYILASYRPASNSYAKSAASMGYVHNETVNIYSHLLGSIAFVIGSFVLYHSLQPRYEQASWQDFYVFSCFFGAAVGCLGISAGYHLFSNHSEDVCALGARCDHLGIVLLIWGSFIPTVYYGFACDPTLVQTYWAMISTIGAACALTTSLPRFRTPAWRPFRAAMFIAMGLSALIPVFHALSLYGLSEVRERTGLDWLVLQGVLYIIGGVLYATRVPECFAPGAFDLIGNSHNMLHVMVLLAASAHLNGLLKAFDFHHSRLDCSRRL